MFVKFKKGNLTAMMGISSVEDASRYGIVKERCGKVLSFEEKGVKGAGWINNGNYIFKEKAFDGYSGVFSLEKDLFPKLVKNQELGAFRVKNDNFIDIGVPEDYEKLCNMYETSK
jgi:NDP-sugar pyrophosphorylase family protein